MDQELKQPTFLTMYTDGEKPQSLVAESFMDNFKWLITGGLDVLSGAHRSMFGTQDKDYSVEDLIASAVPKTVGDRAKKQKRKAYYEANSQILEYVLREVFSQQLYKSLSTLCDHEKKLAQKRYCDILQGLMLDRNGLINEYNENIGGRKLPNCKHIAHTVNLHNILRQAIYGNYSFNSFADYEPGAGIAVVRQVVEIRIRRAFGILGYFDKNDGIQPISMSAIFEVLKKHKITCNLSIQSIERIYSLPNIYIHLGEIPYSWYPIFFELVLRPLTFGHDVKTDKGNYWDVNNALQIKRSELEAIQNEILIGRTNASRLISCQPECEVVE